MSRRRRPSTSRRWSIEFVTNGGPAKQWWWRVMLRGKLLVSCYEMFSTKRSAYRNLCSVMHGLALIDLPPCPKIPVKVKG